jgi:oxygen-independent coproporphyrinogen-3 oxidase
MSPPALAPVSEISVYAHVPFCRSRCSYCGFYFETTRSPSLVDRTLEAIVEEARAYRTALGGPRARTLYLGGGTPSVVEPEKLAAFIAELRETFRGDRVDRPYEVCVEANPESVDRRFLAALGEAGVTRLSLGVQSLNDELLASLGRRARLAEIDAALDALSTHWRGRVSVDLISGIPGQTERDVEEAVQRLAACSIDHVSLYALTVEPGTPLDQAVAAGRTELPRTEEQEQLWFCGARELERRLFHWYEISNFGRNGDRSLHNSAYWRYEPYIGLGPGAAGTLRTAEGGRVRITNGDLFGYLRTGTHTRNRSLTGTHTLSRTDARAGNEAALLPEGGTAEQDRITTGGAHPHRGAQAGVEHLGAREQLFELFLCGLRTDEGIPLHRVRDECGLEPDRVREALRREWPGFRHLCGDALADGRILLDREGRLTLDRLLPSLGRALEEALPSQGTMAGSG